MLQLFRPGGLAVLVLLGGGLLDSCQSSRPSFSFEPAPRATAVVETPVLISAPPSAQAPPETSVRGLAGPLGVKSSAHGSHLARKQMGVIIPRRPAQWTRLARFSPNPGPRLGARPQPAAEAGLGTTVIGILGLLIIPVGLIGLALGGGLVWGLVAAAGAAAVLVAYLDPFGG
jgi:hypothetical protein